MSKGPGRIERAIAAVFEAEPDNAFLADEVAERAYPGVNRVEKKHRVAVLRAVKSLAKTSPNIAWLHGGGLGGRVVIFNQYSVGSYAMARLKADSMYKPNDPRMGWSRTENELKSEIVPTGRKHKYVTEDGAWWRHVQTWVAERDGDTEMAERMKAENGHLLAMIGAGISKK